MFSVGKGPLIMLLQKAAEIGMHVMEAKIQIKIQGRFCYLESQFCCYTVTLLEPRFIFCKQYKQHGLQDCFHKTTDHHRPQTTRVFQMRKTVDHTQNLSADSVEILLSLHKIGLLEFYNTTAKVIPIFYWIKFQIYTPNSFCDGNNPV